MLLFLCYYHKILSNVLYVATNSNLRFETHQVMPIFSIFSYDTVISLLGDVVHAIEVISEVILHYPEEERLSSNLLYYNRQVKKLKINSLGKF